MLLSLSRKEGYHVRAHKVPMTPEKAPGDDDIDSLVKIFLESDPEKDSVVVNCQMGMGRCKRSRAFPDSSCGSFFPLFSLIGCSHLDDGRGLPVAQDPIAGLEQERSLPSPLAEP